MNGICVRCRRGAEPDFSRSTDSLRVILPLCEECKGTVMRTQLPEIREAIVKVIAP